MASVQSMFIADKQLVFFTFVWAREDVYFWVKFVKMPKQKQKLVCRYLTVLRTLIKHALSTNQSARYIEFLL